MTGRHRLTSVETVREEGSWLFTVRNGRGEDEEVFLVPCEDGASDDDGGESDDGGAHKGDGRAGKDDGGAHKGDGGAGKDDGGAGTDDGNPGVEAWVNRCTHEAQRLYREGIGAVTRNGGIVCPKHGSIFDACSGDCDNGDAAGTTLVSVEVTVEDGQVYLVDDDYSFLYSGPAADDDDDDEGPSSTSHLQL